MRIILNPCSRGLLFSILILLSAPIMGQVDLSSKLGGTWKVKDAEMYENWHVVNSELMKGVSYQLEGSKVKVLEYLNLTKSKASWTYSAQVLEQNEGATIQFKQAKMDSSWCFENKKHDFPSKICYRFISEYEVEVSLDGMDRETVEFIMEKVSDEPATAKVGDNPDYDEALASSLGADEYGMKPYMLVMLRSGINDTISSDRRQELFRGHMENMRRLAKEGKLIVAGPLGPNEWGYRGIFILDARDMAEANILLNSDPAIDNGILSADILPWYGSAALPEYLPASEKIWKTKP